MIVLEVDLWWRMAENVHQSLWERKEKARYGLLALQAGGKKSVDGSIGVGAEIVLFDKTSSLYG